MIRIFHILRWMTLGAQTRRVTPGQVDRLLRSIWMVFPFGLMVILLRCGHWIKGPMRVMAHTSDDCLLQCDLPDMIPLYVATFGTWEPDIAAIIRKRLRQGDVFVDVGANIGFDSLLAARVVGDTGGVIAIEADPEMQAVLERNISCNAWANQVRVVGCAVSDESGELHLERGFTHNRGRTRTLAATQPSAANASVHARALPDLLTPDEITRTRMIKIDVEGAEPAVLRGLLPMLDTCPDDVMLLVELSPQWWEDQSLTPISVLQPFVDRGFQLFTVANNYWPWRYMWPQCVMTPTPLDDALKDRPRRIDLVLCREDLA